MNLEAASPGEESYTCCILRSGYDTTSGMGFGHRMFLPIVAAAAQNSAIKDGRSSMRRGLLSFKYPFPRKPGLIGVSGGLAVWYGWGWVVHFWEPGRGNTCRSISGVRITEARFGVYVDQTNAIGNGVSISADGHVKCVVTDGCRKVGSG